MEKKKLNLENKTQFSLTDAYMLVFKLKKLLAIQHVTVWDYLQIIYQRFLNRSNFFNLQYTTRNHFPLS